MAVDFGLGPDIQAWSRLEARAEAAEARVREIADGSYEAQRRLGGRIETLEVALQGLYDFLPRWSCKASEPDGCPVCVARAALKGQRADV